jgi:hypothetical protein
MIDFEKFKNQMITIKKGVVDKSGKQIEEELKEQNEKGETMDFKKFMEIYNEDLSTWKKKLEDKDFDDGVKMTVHQRTNPGYAMDLMRLDCVLKNIKPESIFDYFLNPPNTDGMMKECSTVEEHKDGSVTKYMRMKIPMMTERDNVVRICFLN